METKKLKPFDLEKAKAGAKVITRDGRNVRIICWDKMDDTYPLYSIVALVKNEYGTNEEVATYPVDGVFVVDHKDDLDLCMAPTTVERWVNVYKNEYKGYYFGTYYDSEQEALKFKSNEEYVATTKITWEE